MINIRVEKEKTEERKNARPFVMSDDLNGLSSKHSSLMVQSFVILFHLSGRMH
jgi:hypothetical protein